MDILVVAATWTEIQPALDYFDLKNTDFQIFKNIDILISGVGMVSTAYALGHALALKKYDLLLNLGIAGSFNRTIALGSLVNIVEDTFVELGADDGDNFIKIDDMGLGQQKMRVKNNRAYPFYSAAYHSKWNYGKYRAWLPASHRKNHQTLPAWRRKHGGCRSFICRKECGMRLLTNTRHIKLCRKTGQKQLGHSKGNWVVECLGNSLFRKSYGLDVDEGEALRTKVNAKTRHYLFCSFFI